MKIGIIIGSVREGRTGEAVAEWVYETAGKRTDDGTTYELIDLKSFNVPVLSAATVPGAANKEYHDENVTAWSKAIDDCDAFIFVTPEYNHGVPGGLKNAYDSLGNEWLGKPVAFVSYGAEGGVRAVEHWRSIVSNFQQPDVRAQVTFLLHAHFDQDGFKPPEQTAQDRATLVDQLVELSRRMRR